jgi:hypothetical protein
MAPACVSTAGRAVLREYLDEHTLGLHVIVLVIRTLEGDVADLARALDVDCRHGTMKRSIPTIFVIDDQDLNSIAFRMLRVPPGA